MSSWTPGSQYIKRMQRLVGTSAAKFIVKRASTHSDDPKDVLFPKSNTVGGSAARKRWLDVGLKVIAQVSAKHNKAAICDALRTSQMEHMSTVDAYDGERGRKGRGDSLDTGRQMSDEEKEGIDLLEVAPVVDGRLRNVAKEKGA